MAKDWYGIATTKPGEIIGDIDKDNADFERWTALGPDDPAYKKAQESVKPNVIHMSLHGVAKISDQYDEDVHYLAAYCGGLNGGSIPYKWATYLDQIKVTMRDFKHSWLVELYNDCCDDVWYLIVGFDM